MPKIATLKPLSPKKTSTENPPPVNAVRAWRQKRGMTLQQLADGAGTTRAQINKLESGSRRLTADWMLRLGRALDCDPRALMGGAPKAAAETMKIHRQDNAMAVVRHVLRPYFAGAEAYGVIVRDNRLAPMLRAGQTAFVDPERPPRAGQAVLRREDGNMPRFYIYRGKQDGQIKLTALGREILMATQDVTLHPVVGAAEPDL